MRPRLRSDPDLDVYSFDTGRTSSFLMTKIRISCMHIELRHHYYLTEKERFYFCLVVILSHCRCVCSIVHVEEKQKGH